jgi:uncharacterized protein (DUF362 family)
MRKNILRIFGYTLLFFSLLACDGNAGNHPENNTFTITFNANGGSGGPGPVTATFGEAMPVITEAPTKADYHFNGYWDAASAGTMYYTADLVSTRNWDKKANAALYAQWSQIPFTTIIFNANNGYGTMQAQQIPENTSANLAANTFVWIGYQFEGWAESPNGTIAYTDGQNYAAAAGINTVILYAVWSDPPPPPAVSTDYSTVSLVQSTSTAQASNLTYAEILALTREAVKLAGGLGGIVKTGDTVVLKPNVIVTRYSWGGGSVIPELVNGICTDRRVIQAVAEIVREIVGPTGRIILMEGSGSGSSTNNFANLGYTKQNFVNVDDIIALEDEGTWVAPGDASGSTGYVTQVTLDDFAYTAPISGGRYSNAAGDYADYYRGDGVYYVNKKMLDADALICIPVVKQHWDAAVTGAIKNIAIGAAPPSVYGLGPGSAGRNGMVNHAAVDNFHGWIADYFSCLPADFVVMDGLQGLQRGPLPNGVSSEALLAQHQKNLRCILASKDSLAIDIVEANLMNWDYTTVPYFETLTAKGEVSKNGRVIPLRGNPQDIVVLGNVKLNDIRVDFEGTMSAGMPGDKISMANRTLPTITINSAAFSGSTLNLNLTLSTGANNNVVKIDVYIDGEYTASIKSGMNVVALDASGLAAGQHTIEVRAYTKYMYSQTATTTATL